VLSPGCLKQKCLSLSLQLAFLAGARRVREPPAQPWELELKSSMWKTQVEAQRVRVTPLRQAEKLWLVL